MSLLAFRSIQRKPLNQELGRFNGSSAKGVQAIRGHSVQPRSGEASPTILAVQCYLGG